jgi:dual specificity phosphatase 12
MSKVDTLSPSAPAALARMRYPALLAERRAAAAAGDLLQDLGGLHLGEGVTVGDTGDGGAPVDSPTLPSLAPPAATVAAAAGVSSNGVHNSDPSSSNHGSQEQQQWPAPSSRWFQALLLDCDGVLVDTERASCEALRRSTLEVTGVSIPGEFPRDYEEVFGMDVLGCVLHYKRKMDRWVG